MAARAAFRHIIFAATRSKPTFSVGADARPASLQSGGPSTHIPDVTRASRRRPSSALAFASCRRIGTRLRHRKSERGSPRVLRNRASIKGCTLSRSTHVVHAGARILCGRMVAFPMSTNTRTWPRSVALSVGKLGKGPGLPLFRVGTASFFSLLHGLRLTSNMSITLEPVQGPLTMHPYVATSANRGPQGRQVISPQIMPVICWL